MYNKPMTEVMNLKTASLMLEIVVSPGTSSGGSSTPPPVHAPSRGGEVIE